MGTYLNVELYTDGACSGNPGPGGYAFLLRYTNPSGKLYEKEGSEGFSDTTNNRMELMAALKGLEALTKPCHVYLYSDSQYLVKAFTENWYHDWKKADFRRGKRNEVKNIDLWEQFEPFLEKHAIEFIWVKGHDDNEYNNRCDKMAVAAYQKFLKA